MRYGVREIANVMLKAKVDGQMVGNKPFKKGQPVCHFTSLKTSNVEGAATTVYANGGRGNSRLIAWEGERTLTLTMEDALISAMGIAILTGAGLIEANTNNKVMTHIVEDVDFADSKFTVSKKDLSTGDNTAYKDIPMWACNLDADGNLNGTFYPVNIANGVVTEIVADDATALMATSGSIRVDYYYQETSKATHIDIEPGKFGGNYYLEAETLFRDETTGRDDAAEFILPNCHIQSNFTFSMAASGDPSTFTFTVDAFPGTIVGMGSKKVLCAIQIVESGE